MVYTDGAGASAAVTDALVNLALTAPTLTGTAVVASLDISGDIDVDGTTNLDVVDIDGAVDMASTLAVGGVVTANAGVVVDNITIDGTEIDLSSGDLTIDVAGDIFLDADGGQVYFQNGSTLHASIDMTGGVIFRNHVSDADIFIQGNDGGSNINMLTFDTSEGGNATFAGALTINGDDGLLVYDTNGSSSNRLKFLYNGTSGVATVGPHSTGGNTQLNIGTSDSGTFATALTIDSSQNATFAGDVVVNKYLRVRTTDDQANQWYLYSHTDDTLRINYNGAGADAIIIDTSENATFAGNVRVTAASSGATPTAGTVATFEGNDNTEISILGGSSSVLGINFGHSGDNDEGRITFNTTAGAEDLELISSNTITLDAAGDIKFGTFGQIGVSGGNNLYVSGSATDHAGVTFATQSILPTTEGSLNNNTVDLGQNGNAYKDLYIGSGIFLGGTGSANKLDDYEEGTWTPTYIATTSDFSSVTYSSQVGTYTKIGNQVTVWFNVRTSGVSGGSGTVKISGLPFAANISPNVGPAVFSAQDAWVSAMPNIGWVDTNSQLVLAYGTDSSTTYATIAPSNMSNSSNSNRVYGCATYTTT